MPQSVLSLFQARIAMSQNADVLAGRVLPPPPRLTQQKCGPFIVINGVMGKWPYKWPVGKDGLDWIVFLQADFDDVCCVQKYKRDEGAKNQVGNGQVQGFFHILHHWKPLLLCKQFVAANVRYAQIFASIPLKPSKPPKVRWVRWHPKKGPEIWTHRQFSWDIHVFLRKKDNLTGLGPMDLADVSVRFKPRLLCLV